MKKAAIVLIAGLLLAGTGAIVSEAGDSRSFAISITIPHIVGINTPGTTASSSLENTAIHNGTITQVERRQERNKTVVLRTTLLK